MEKHDPTFIYPSSSKPEDLQGSFLLLLPIIDIPVILRGFAFMLLTTTFIQLVSFVSFAFFIISMGMVVISHIHARARGFP